MRHFMTFKYQMLETVALSNSHCRVDSAKHKLALPGRGYSFWRGSAQPKGGRYRHRIIFIPSVVSQLPSITLHSLCLHSDSQSLQSAIYYLSDEAGDFWLHRLKLIQLTIVNNNI